jgi:RsiW-degrading membrane proteinase PrsW (M82 family)
VTRYGSPRLLTPPREEEEVYPYRPVWESIAIETAILFFITLGLYIAIGWFGIRVPTALNRPVNLGLALSPAMLWVVASLWRERAVPQPRHNLAGVFVISALAANAIGIPFLNSLKTDEWLPFLGMFERIFGYAVTAGIVQETLKYLVVRYAVWPNAFRIRLDSVAYFATAAVAYATVANLHLVFGETMTPDVFSMRVFSATTMHLAASVFVAYGLAEARFNPRTFFVMPMMMLFAALMTGIIIVTRSSMINTKFFLGISATRPLFGLVVSLGMVIVALVVGAFLFNVAEREEREAVAGQEG